MQHIPISAVGFRDFHRAVLPRTQTNIDLNITATGAKPMDDAFVHTSPTSELTPRSRPASG